MFRPPVLNHSCSQRWLSNAFPLNSKALSIFDVKVGQLDLSSPDFIRFVKQISKAVNVCNDKLLMQIEDMYPRVKAMSTMTDCTNKEIWKKLYDKINAVKSTAMAHPMDALVEGLILLLVFGASSSGVEQFFAKLMRVFTKQRRSALPGTEEACLKVMADLSNHNLDLIIGTAQKVWSCVYGEARATQTRCSMGVKRAKHADSEATFIRKRREAAAEGSLSSSSTFERLTSVSAFDVAQPGWSEQHTKELSFQQDKQHAREVQAVAEGNINGNDALKAELMAVKNQRVKDQRARERKEHRDNCALVGATCREVLGRISGHTACILCDMSPDLQDAVALFHLKLGRACDADVFVVQLPGNLDSQRVGLISALRGSFHISPSVLISRGERGLAAKWRPVADVERVIFVSQATQDRNKRTFELFMEVLKSHVGNRIQIVLGKDWDELSRLTVKYAKVKSKLVAIVRTSELKLPVSASVVDVRIVLKSTCLICLVCRVYLFILKRY